MSQPNRFRCLTTEEQREFNNKVIMPGLVMCEDGNLVAYSDYAALAAEKEIEIKVLRDEADCVREENVALSRENAALAAENERLRSKLSFSQSISEICKQVQDGETITVQGSISSGKTVLADLFQCERLLAENERLRKAGDAMAKHYFDLYWIMNAESTSRHEPASITDWEAAKEGGRK